LLDDLHNFLEENRKDILAFIESSRRPNNLDYDNNTFEKFLRYLVANIPVCHCNPSQLTHREFDKVHYELAVAFLEVFWCGCIPQMKENSQAYPPGTTDTFRKILVDVFGAGRKYGPMEEIRRQKEHARTPKSE
jgi:hypothetical protein